MGQKRTIATVKVQSNQKILKVTSQGAGRGLLYQKVVTFPFPVYLTEMLCLENKNKLALTCSNNMK